MKVNLTLLKRLVSELESALAAGDKLTVDKTDLNQYVVEMSKAIGLASGVMSEASMLIVDINTVVRSQDPSGKADSMDKLLAAFKTGGAGGLGNTN